MRACLEGDWEREGAVGDPDLLADERCRQVVLDFLSTTDVRWMMPAEEDAVSEVSRAELRVRVWVKELGAEERGAGEGLPMFLPPPDFMARAGVEQGGGCEIPLFLSSVFSSAVSLFRCASSWELPGRRARGNWYRAADSGQETDCT